jgi:hypothetical protein
MCAEHTDEVMMDLMVTEFDKKDLERFEKKYLPKKKKDDK